MRHSWIAACLSLAVASLPLQPVFAESFPLEEGTRVRLRTLEPITMASAVEGEKVLFKVVEDVLAADQKTVLIASGASAFGYLTSASSDEKALALSVDKVKAVDGSTVPLRGSVKRMGSQYAWGKAAALVVLVGVFALPALPFLKGKKAKIPGGTIVNAFVDRNLSITFDSPKPKETAEAKLEPQDPQGSPPAEVPSYLQKYINTPQPTGATP